MKIKSEKFSTGSYWANLFRSPNEKSDIEAVLASMPLFNKVEKKHLNSFLKLIHNRVYNQNEYVFYQGDPGICLYIIRDGIVDIIQSDEFDNKFKLISLKRGDFFGELALLDDEVRSATAVAKIESNLAVIFKPDLDEFVEKYPEVGVNIMRGIAQVAAIRLRNVNTDFMNCFIKLNSIKQESSNDTNKENSDTN